MKVSLKSITPDAELNIVEIARVSSSRVDKTEKPEGLIGYLINNKHWSPFQHSYLTFEIVTSKAIGIQLLRHLSFTFQEFSQRYAEVDNVEPIEFRLQADKNRQSSTNIIGNVWQDGDSFAFDLDKEFQPDSAEIWEWLRDITDYMQQTLDLYKRGIKLGVAKECTRMILPMATQTTIYMTGSIRSWIHFLDIRDDAHAQKEAQEIARAIKAFFIDRLPLISTAKGYVKG